MDETELQVILATSQEVKKAIQMKQKGRQFYKGGAKGKGRGSPCQDYIKDKKKTHIEQLKLRTRCARYSTVGHWAPECMSPPDDRRAAASTSSLLRAPVQSRLQQVLQGARAGMLLRRIFAP
jgi:hypothetical protein